MASDPSRNPDPSNGEKDHFERNSSTDSKTEVEHADHAEYAGSSSRSQEHPRHAPADGMDGQRVEASHKLAHPLAGLNAKQLARLGEDYARKAGLTDEEDLRAFRLGAMIAGDENKFDTISDLTEREREVLGRELTHKWSNPSMLYWVIVSKSFAHVTVISIVQSLRV